jgi:hypothetical protein
MASRIRTDILQADRNALIALEAISDYAPRNSRYSVQNGKAADAAVQATHAKIVRLKADLAAALDEAADNETEFHSIILGAKKEVGVQYGDSSDQVQALGLKKKDERKRPVRRASKADTSA